MSEATARLWDREFREKTVADSLADYRRRRAEEEKQARQEHHDRQRKLDF